MWDGKSTGPGAADHRDGTTTISARLVLASRVDGAAADFYKLLTGNARTITAARLNEFLQGAEDPNRAGGAISSSIPFVKPHNMPTLMPVRTDAARQKFRDVTWWRGVGVGKWIYVLYSEQPYRFEEWANKGNNLQPLTPTGRRGFWKLATRFGRGYRDPASAGPNAWDVSRSVTDKTMDVVAAKYTVPAALARVQQGIELLDSTAHFIPAYAGAKMAAYGDTRWDRGMGVILIAADTVPFVGAVRGVSKTVRVGATSFVAIGAGARIINGVKQAAEGTADLGTGIDVGIAIIEGTVYALAHVNLKLRVRGVDKLDDSADLMRMLDDVPDGQGGKAAATVADDASAEELAKFLGGRRSAADIKDKGLSSDELVELIDANPAAVRAQVGRPVAAASGAPQARVGNVVLDPHSHAGGYHGTRVPSGQTARDVIDDTFARGMPERGRDMDLRHHAEEFGRNATTMEGRSAFRGTTQQIYQPESGQGAAAWADVGGIVYQVDGVPTWNVNLALDGRVEVAGRFRGNLMHGEGEHAILSAVPRERIRRAGVVERTPLGRLLVREWIDNPHYVPR